MTLPQQPIRMSSPQSIIPRLRPVPDADPRPELDSDVVLDASLAQLDAPLTAWARGKVALDPDLLRLTIKAALRHQGPDAFRVAWALKEHFGWPADTALVLILNRCFLTLPEARRSTVAAWAVRTGMRFPGAAEDVVEWVDVAGGRKAGKVIGLANGQAAAWVCRASDDAHEFVLAEGVVGNITQAWYGLRDVVLGQRYEDAPALAALAAMGRPFRPRTAHRCGFCRTAVSTETLCAACGGRGYIEDDDDPPPVAA